VLDEARVPVGRVEEVFGPVTQPFYVLRWAGSGDAPQALSPGAAISTVPRLMAAVVPEALVRDTNGGHTGGGGWQTSCRASVLRCTFN
jgi:hypothetical protein